MIFSELLQSIMIAILENDELFWVLEKVLIHEVHLAQSQCLRANSQNILVTKPLPHTV